MAASRRRSVSMSRTWGMFSRMTSPSVRMAAAMQGRAEFFAPETLMVPRRGLPPRTTNLSIGLVYGRWRCGDEWLRWYGLARRGIRGETAFEAQEVLLEVAAGEV